MASESEVYSWEPHPLHPNGTETLHRIAVDYCPEACLHERHAGEIHVTYDARGGARWRSLHRFRPGSAVAATIRAPAGDTSGLNYNIYLSSLECSTDQDEIDFEFLGRDKRAVQTNYHVGGVGGREQIHALPFDSSDGFHHYAIAWDAAAIEWRVDGKLVRREERRKGEPWPEKPMYLYASVWDASYIADGAWTGKYHGRDAPYVCSYKDVRVPTAEHAVEEEGRQDADAADAPADDPEADATSDAPAGDPEAAAAADAPAADPEAGAAADAPADDPKADAAADAPADDPEAAAAADETADDTEAAAAAADAPADDPEAAAAADSPADHPEADAAADVAAASAEEAKDAGTGEEEKDAGAGEV